MDWRAHGLKALAVLPVDRWEQFYEWLADPHLLALYEEAPEQAAILFLAAVPEENVYLGIMRRLLRFIKPYDHWRKRCE